MYNSLITLNEKMAEMEKNGTWNNKEKYKELYDIVIHIFGENKEKLTYLLYRMVILISDIQPWFYRIYKGQTPIHKNNFEDFKESVEYTLRYFEHYVKEQEMRPHKYEDKAKKISISIDSELYEFLSKLKSEMEIDNISDFTNTLLHRFKKMYEKGKRENG